MFPLNKLIILLKYLSFLKNMYSLLFSLKSVGEKIVEVNMHPGASQLILFK